MTHWMDLMKKVRGSDGEPVPALEARVELGAFRDSGRRPTFGWLPCTLPHEESGRPETWGPTDPGEVNWHAF